MCFYTLKLGLNVKCEILNVKCEIKTKNGISVHLCKSVNNQTNDRTKSDNS